MVAPAILVSKHRTTPTQLGYLTSGTAFNQLGTSVVSGEVWTAQQGFPSNRGVWFKGCYFTLIIVGTSWTTQVYDPVANTLFNNTGLAVAMTPSLAGACSGLFVTRAVNPVMFCVTTGSSNSLFLHTTTDGRNWVSTFLSFSTFSSLGRCVLYRNQLYIPVGEGTLGFVIVNPTTLTMTTFTAASLGWTASLNSLGSFCVFRNKVYLLRKPFAGQLDFYEFTGGTMVLRNTLQAGLSEFGSMWENTDGLLFPVGSTKMVAMCMVDTGNSQATRGTKAWDLTPTTPTSFSVVDKSSSLIPSNLARVADGGGTGVLASTNRWTGFVDNDFNTTPGSPQVYIWLMSDFAGGTYTYFEYVDSDTTLGPGTTGPSQDFALPYGSAGGGDRTYASFGLKAIVTNVAPSPSPGRVRVTAIVYGDIDPAVSQLGGGQPPTGFTARRASCVAATTAALPAVTYSNGAAGLGATLTRVGNGALPLQDNVSLTSLQRLLVKDQASAFENGIYEVTALGDGSNPFVLTRVVDFDTFSGTNIYPTVWTRITGGDTYTNTAWYFRASSSDLVIGTTAITWAQMDSGGTPLNRRLRLWYSTNETPNMVQATLAGTPTQVSVYGPSGAAPVVTRNVNALENIAADGEMSITFDWDAATDALQSGQAVHFMVRAGTA